MPGTQVFNFQLRVGMAQPLVRHLIGVDRPETSLPREGMPPVVLFDANGTIIRLGQAEEQYQEAKDHLKKLIDEQAKRRGRKSHGVVNILVAGLDWERDKHGDVVKHVSPTIHQWARESIAFFRKRLGSQSRIAVASIHLDEKSPHLHLLLVCANEQRRLGWGNVRNALAGIAPDDVIRNRRDGKSKMKGRPRANFRATASSVHQRFYQVVSKRFGIDPPVPQKKPVTRREIDREDSFRSRVEEAYNVGISKGKAQIEKVRGEAREQVEIAQKDLDAVNWELELTGHRADELQEQFTAAAQALADVQSAADALVAEAEARAAKAIENVNERLAAAREDGFLDNELARIELAAQKDTLEKQTEQQRAALSAVTARVKDLEQQLGLGEQVARPEVGARPARPVPEPQVPVRQPASAGARTRSQVGSAASATGPQPQPVEAAASMRQAVEDVKKEPGALPGTAAAAATGRKPEAAKQPAPPPGGRREQPQPAPQRPVGSGGASRPAAPGVTRPTGQRRGPVPAPERPPGPGAGRR